MIRINIMTRVKDITYINNDVANGLYIDKNGDMYWFQNGKHHRDEDKPALIKSDGNKFWYKNNLLHRDDDKPAIIYNNGDKVWCQNGEHHRDNDKPAMECKGYKAWFKNGKRYYPDKE